MPDEELKTPSDQDFETPKSKHFISCLGEKRQALESQDSLNSAPNSGSKSEPIKSDEIPVEVKQFLTARKSTTKITHLSHLNSLSNMITHDYPQIIFHSPT